MRRRPAVRSRRARSRAGRLLLLSAADSRPVLVTGAAGRIGAELCGALAERGHAVLALVRRATRLVRADGTLIATEASPRPGHVTLLRGDVGAPDLGLGAAVQAIVAGCGEIVHCAGETRMDGGADHAINVVGTQNLLDAIAAAPSRPGLVHVSTAYVCGARRGEIAELPADGSGSNKYEASKIEAERRVLASGLDAAVARPSIVVGRWQDGAISRFDNIYGLLRLVGEGRIATLPAAESATLDLVPLDHVVGGLTDLVERFDDAKGRIFHLATGAPMPVAQFCAMIFPGFHQARVVPPSTDAGGRDGMVRQTIIANYATYLAHDPRFATGNLRDLSGRVSPPSDAAFVRRLVDYACHAGFLRRDPRLMRETLVT